MIFFIDNISIMQRNFEYSLRDVKVLVDLYDSIVETKNVAHYARYESLKRSSIFLLTASWENYIEDTIKITFESLLEKINSPKEIESTFNSVANSWIDNYKDRKVKAPDLILWTNESWKDIMRSKIRKDIDNLNTPNSVNLSYLFKTYFGEKLDSVFKTKGSSILIINKHLDSLIKIRGEIAHQAKKEVAKTKLNLSLKYVKSSISFIEKLVNAVEKNFVYKFRN
jgi:hypothetical protein